MENTLEAKGRLDCAEPSRHHTIFSQFTPFQGCVESAFWVEYTGARFRNAFEDRKPVHQPSAKYFAPIPPFNEEYLEWATLLTAVANAFTSFTMVELGAGMGHWLLNGALGARQKKLGLRLVGVEAEPTHFAFMKQAFADNGLDPQTHQLIQAAVGPEAGEQWFAAGNADRWYGQYLVDERHVQSLEADEQNAQENQFVKVPVVTLHSILTDLPHVDLLDMDVQGAEADVVEHSTEQLDETVDITFIGTHNVDVEVRLRAAFQSIGWINVFDFPCVSGINQTPYGPINLPDDGIQCWVNPRCADVAAQLLDGFAGEWEVCRYQNVIGSISTLSRRLHETERDLRQTKDRLIHTEHLRTFSELQKTELEDHLRSIQQTFEGVSPRMAKLVRRARSVKSFFTRFGKRRQVEPTNNSQDTERKSSAA